MRDAPEFFTCEVQDVEPCPRDLSELFPETKSGWYGLLGPGDGTRRGASQLRFTLHFEAAIQVSDYPVNRPLAHGILARQLDLG